MKRRSSSWPALLLAAALCSTATVRAQPAPPAEIRIATEGAFAPWNFVNPAGRLDGFEVELARALCDRAKLRCEIVAQDWDGILPSLLARKYDAVIAAMQITDKRLEVVDFTRPYASGVHGLMVQRGRVPAGLPEGFWHLDRSPAEAKVAIAQLRTALTGKTIGVQGSTSNARFVAEHLKDVVQVREYKTSEQHDLDLAAGRIDAVFGAHPTFLATLATPFGKDMQVAGPTFRGGTLGRGAALALRKDNTALRERLDTALASLLVDGTVRVLSMKWFRIDLTPPP
jgi:octopine/nopaline transport system substrate-binding protein